jgi:hypothetical protein
MARYLSLVQLPGHGPVQRLDVQDLRYCLMMCTIFSLEDFAVRWSTETNSLNVNLIKHFEIATATDYVGKNWCIIDQGSATKL